MSKTERMRGEREQALPKHGNRPSMPCECFQSYQRINAARESADSHDFRMYKGSGEFLRNTTTIHRHPACAYQSHSRLLQHGDVPSRVQENRRIGDVLERVRIEIICK